MKRKIPGQLDLFEEPKTEGATPPRSYADGLLEQIRRDVETLRSDECAPGRAFYEARIEAYREEYKKVKVKMG